MTFSLPHARWLGLAGLVPMHAASWPGLASILVVAASSLAGLLAELGRRKTLIQFPLAGTVMMQGDGPGGPAVRARAGDGQPGSAPGGRP